MQMTLDFHVCSLVPVYVSYIRDVYRLLFVCIVVSQSVILCLFLRREHMLLRERDYALYESHVQYYYLF